VVIHERESLRLTPCFQAYILEILRFFSSAPGCHRCLCPAILILVLGSHSTLHPHLSPLHRPHSCASWLIPSASPIILEQRKRRQRHSTFVTRRTQTRRFAGCLWPLLRSCRSSLLCRDPVFATKARPKHSRSITCVPCQAADLFRLQSPAYSRLL
jgi:hypothetical protein